MSDLFLRSIKKVGVSYAILYVYEGGLGILIHGPRKSGWQDNQRFLSQLRNGAHDTITHYR